MKPTLARERRAPRKMWAYIDPFGDPDRLEVSQVRGTMVRHKWQTKWTHVKDFPVLVLPWDKTSRDALEERLARLIDPEGFYLAENPPKDPRVPWMDYRIEARQKAKAAVATLAKK